MRTEQGGASTHSTFAVPETGLKPRIGMSDQSAFTGERADLPPTLDPIRPGQAQRWLWEAPCCSLIADGGEERLHHLAQRLPLGRRGRDEGRQGPERLRLCVSTARSRRAIKPCLDLLLKGMKQSVIVWGCSQ